MPEAPTPDTARRRELMDAIGRAAEMHHHKLLVLVVLIGAQGITAGLMEGTNAVIIAAMGIAVLTLGARLWVYHDLLASLRLRLRPLMEGESPTPDSKTRQQLDWLTQQDPLLDRLSVWGLWLSAVLYAGGCIG